MLIRSLCASLCAIALALLLPVVTCAQTATAWPTPQWQTATPESQGLSTAKLEEAKLWLEQNGSKTGLVIRHGRIVGEWYFGDAKVDSRFLVYSTSKSFASTAAGVAIAEGKLKLDSTVGQFVPQASPALKHAITVKQLISMTSGVHNNKGFGTIENQFTYSMQEAPMDHPPGTKWDYNNTGLALLSPVLKKATGQPIDEYLRDKVFRRIGIADGDWTWDARENYPLSYSGLHITGRSLARFGLLFLNRGQWDKEQVLSAAWVREATAPSQDLNKSYGYLWWNNTTDKWPGVPSDAYAALGAFDNDMLIVPSLDLIVIRQVGDDRASGRKVKIADYFKLACDAVEKK